VKVIKRTNIFVGELASGYISRGDGTILWSTPIWSPVFASHFLLSLFLYGHREQEYL
jgi:hypothetical protein